MKRVLVVDDELISAKTLAMFLEDEGYNVRTVGSGVEALAIGSEYKPDLLVSDWKLRDELDGIAVAKELKRLNPQLRTILCSGLGLEDLKAKAGETEIFCFLGKPFGLDEMLEVIQAAFENPENQKTSC